LNSRWPDKFVIGLTGNIGTGKSVVRKMLEHLGAYGIDADALSHRAISKGAPGYQLVINKFGTWLVNKDGEIDRARLGRVVFSDPEALQMLEDIIHPLVYQAVDILVKHSTYKVVVIEAIKLIESSLGRSSESIWVTTVPEPVQIQRLVESRGMNEADAKQRVSAQSTQQQKIIKANVVIENGKSFAETWRQVSAAWISSVPENYRTKSNQLDKARVVKNNKEVTVRRGHPQDADLIASFLNKSSINKDRYSAEDIMANLGERAYIIFLAGTRVVGLVGLQVENLIARTIDIVVDPDVPISRILPQMIMEMERASRDLQCEVSLVYAPPRLAGIEMIWKSLGYEPTLPEKLEVRAWQEAAEESRPQQTARLFFKRLRIDRIMKPI